jgi:hypothetical protein
VPQGSARCPIRAGSTRDCCALNHSHICQIFDIGPDDLVLEFVEGVPLEGPLPVRDALPLLPSRCSRTGSPRGRSRVLENASLSTDRRFDL